MKQMKPILFNTEMTQAIDNNIKFATRRLVTPQPQFRTGETGTPEMLDDGSWTFKIDQYETIYDHELSPKYQLGDILYVRETWRVLVAHRFEADAIIGYKAKRYVTSRLVFPGSMSQATSRDEYDEFKEPDYPDIPLNDWMRSIIKRYEFMLYLKPDLDDEELSEQMSEALLDGTGSHEGLLATLYTAAWAFSALREKLKRYEDTGYEPQEIRSLESEWNAARNLVDFYRNKEGEGVND